MSGASPGIIASVPSAWPPPTFNGPDFGFPAGTYYDLTGPDWWAVNTLGYVRQPAAWGEVFPGADPITGFDPDPALNIVTSQLSWDGTGWWLRPDPAISVYEQIAAAYLNPNDTSAYSFGLLTGNPIFPGNTANYIYNLSGGAFVPPAQNIYFGASLVSRGWVEKLVSPTRWSLVLRVASQQVAAGQLVPPGGSAPTNPAAFAGSMLLRYRLGNSPVPGTAGESWSNGGSSVTTGGGGGVFYSGSRTFYGSAINSGTVGASFATFDPVNAKVVLRLGDIGSGGAAIGPIGQGSAMRLTKIGLPVF